MFDIYSLAKPRVFKFQPHDGGGTPGDGGSGIPAPDSVEYESVVLQNGIVVFSEEEAEQFQHPESAGRILVNATDSFSKSINIINAASDLGGRAMRIVNNPFSFSNPEHNGKFYRTEFRPKQGLHNLDFTTPSETPSDNPGGDAPAQ